MILTLIFLEYFSAILIGTTTMEEINKEELEFVQQRTDEWKNERLGKFTASEFSSLVADEKWPMTPSELDARPPKSKITTIADPTLLSDGAKTYILEVAGEILTGVSADSDINTKEMEHGTLHEPDAIKLYARTMGVEVQSNGSLPYSPLKRYVSGSPDGLIDKDGGLEVKCPYKNHIHLKNLLMKDWKDLKDNHKDYFWQVIGGLLITGRKYWDFVSYNPSFKGALQIGIVRVYASDVDDHIRHLAIKLKYAVRELENVLEGLNYKGEVEW